VTPNDRIIELHNLLSASRSADRSAHPPASSGRPPFFFLGGDWFVGRLGENQPVVDLPVDEVIQTKPTIADMADHYVAVVRREQPEGPYLLGGYCFWGYVAYEVAQRLIAARSEVALLALIETCVPGDTYRRLRLPRKVLFSLRYPGEALRFLARSRRSAAPQTRNVIGAYYVEVALRAGRGYRPGPYAGQLTLIFGERYYQRFFPTAGWDRLASGGVRVRLVRGGHHETLFRDESVYAAVRELIASAVGP
jgi:thioesterase domain-containing protein